MDKHFYKKDEEMTKHMAPEFKLIEKCVHCRALRHTYILDGEDVYLYTSDAASTIGYRETYCYGK